MLKRSPLQTVVVKVMKLLPFVASGLFGLTVYLTLELLLGSYGLVAYRAVESYSREVYAAEQSISLRETELETEILNLRTDREAVRREAHDLGLIGDGEGIIRVTGYSLSRTHSYDPGRTAPPMRKIADNRPLFRGLGLAAALVLLIPLLIVQTRERHSR